MKLASSMGVAALALALWVGPARAQDAASEDPAPEARVVSADADEASVQAEIVAPRPAQPPAPPADAPPEVQARRHVVAPDPLDPADPELSGRVDLDRDWGEEPPPGEMGLDRATPQPFTPSDGGGAVTGGIVLLTLAGVSAVTAVVLGGLALAAQGDVEDGCAATMSCTDEDVSEMSSLALAADVAWPTAVGLGVVGATLLIVGLTIHPDEQVDEDVAEEQRAEVRFAPLVGPTQAGLVAVGRF